MNEDLIRKHDKFSSGYSRYGGLAEHGGIEQVIHYDHNGKSVDVVVEHRQSERQLFDLNEQRRNEGGREGAIGKMVADISLLAVQRWKELYGFDLRKANLNDPDQYRIFRRLLDANAQYKTWDGKPKSHFIMI